MVLFRKAGLIKLMGSDSVGCSYQMKGPVIWMCEDNTPHFLPVVIHQFMSIIGSSKTAC